MLTRRYLLMLAGASMALATVMPEMVQAQSGDAVGYIETNGNKIISIARAAQNDPSKRAALLDTVNAVLDVDGIARFALGPYARQATADQMQRYLQLFHQVISTGVTARLAAYQDASFTVGRSDPRGDDSLVHTTISRPGSPAANVDWLVGSVGGQTRILDVIAEGTSLRLTERSDYTSYLQTHGGNVDALITALQGQLAQ